MQGEGLDLDLLNLPVHTSVAALTAGKHGAAATAVQPIDGYSCGFHYRPCSKLLEVLHKTP